MPYHKLKLERTLNFQPPADRLGSNGPINQAQAAGTGLCNVQFDQVLE